MRDDDLAVADRLAVIDNVGQLPARRARSVENVLVRERHAGEPHEGKYLQPIAIIIGDAEQLGVRIERDHGPKIVALIASKAKQADGDGTLRVASPPTFTLAIGAWWLTGNRGMVAELKAGVRY